MPNDAPGTSTGIVAAITARTSGLTYVKDPTSTMILLVPTPPIGTTEKPWKMKLRLKSHTRWAFWMAFLQLTNEAVPYETFLLGSSNITRDLIIYMACLILPIIYWGTIAHSWIKLSKYKNMDHGKSHRGIWRILN